MFGLFQKRPHTLGTYSIKVYRPKGTSVSASYSGSKLPKAHSLFLRGLYIAKTMFALSDPEFTAYALATISKGCLHLQDNESTDITSAIGVEVVPEGRSLTERFLSLSIDVVQGPKFDLPVVQNDLPGDVTAGDLLASIAAFNELWLSENDVQVGDFATRSFLQFFGGFLSYYDNDPAAFLDPQSIIQAPMKAYVMANSNALGLMGLADT